MGQIEHRESPSSYQEDNIISKGELVNLKNDLRLYGFTTIEANICLYLFLHESTPKSGLLAAAASSAPKLEEAISSLKNTGFISEYKGESKNHRKITYYQLEKTPWEIYECLNEKTNTILNELRDSYNGLLRALQLRVSSDTIVERLYRLGIDKAIAQILTDIEFGYYNEKGGRKLYATNEARALFNTGWIYTDKNNLPCLRKNIQQIALDYLETKKEEYSNALGRIKRFIEFLDEHPEIITTSEIAEESGVNDRRYQSHSQSDQYNRKFLKSLHDVVISTSDVTSKPFNIELKSPFPKNVRVYLYKIVHTGCKARNTTEHKIVLHLHGQGYGTRGTLDTSNTTLVLLGGYDFENDVFVFWNAYRHENFAPNTNLQVKEEALIEGNILGLTSYERKVKDNRIETVVVARSDCVKEALLQIYEQYVNELIGDEV